MITHCLFEQSGTFKNEFKKLGYEAYDYDIQNEFGQTDYVVDLFGEIEKAYDGKESLFDKISPDDLILAFFPCTRFSSKVPVLFRGAAPQQKDWSIEKKCEYDIDLHNELHKLWVLLNKMVIVCEKKHLQMVIENPYDHASYLTMYWCIKPTLIDKDRTKNGDYYRKPTQFFFINRKPFNNLVFEPLQYVETNFIKYVHSTKEHTRQEIRSLIHPQYASRFIRQYLIERK